MWNETGGIDPHSGLRASGFNASTWKPVAPGRRAHVFHNGLWGAWIYDVEKVDTTSKTMTFSRGGFQEGRGSSFKLRSETFYLTDTTSKRYMLCVYTK